MEGSLRDGSSFDRKTPVQVAILTRIVAISAGYGYALALRADGILRAWGDNNESQLGDGTFINRLLPGLSLIQSWRWLGASPLPELVSLNDHSPGQRSEDRRKVAFLSRAAVERASCPISDDSCVPTNRWALHIVPEHSVAASGAPGRHRAAGAKAARP